jgi:hypothetical protein
MSEESARPVQQSHEQDVERLFAEVDALRGDLRELNRRLEGSATEHLELRETRASLEERLERLLVQLGAIFYDSRRSGRSARDEKSADQASAPDEPVADEAPQASETPADNEAARADDAPEAVRPGVVDLRREFHEQPLHEPRERSAGREKSARPTSHQIYMTTAKILPAIKSELGSPPTRIETYADVMGELGMLHRAAQTDQLDKWARLPDEVQRALASYVAARLRHLQSENDAGLTGLVANDERVLEIFSGLKNHMETYWPGYAHGLARDHTPLNDSWAADAAVYKETLDELAAKYYGEGHRRKAEEQNPEIALNEIEAFIQRGGSHRALRDFVGERIDKGLRADDPRLVKLLADTEAAFEGSEFSKLRAAFRASDEDEQPQGDEPLIPPGWAWKDKLKRSRVVMIGGDARPDAQARLEAAFEPAEFHWPSIEYNKSTRLVQSWAKRIRRGSVDIVILLTEFVSHKVSDAVVDAIKDASGVELVYVDRGYGVTQIQRGIENFVRRDVAAAPEG